MSKAALKNNPVREILDAVLDRLPAGPLNAARISFPNLVRDVASTSYERKIAKHELTGLYHGAEVRIYPLSGTVVITRNTPRLVS